MRSGFTLLLERFFWLFTCRHRYTTSKRVFLLSSTTVIWSLVFLISPVRSFLLRKERSNCLTLDTPSVYPIFLIGLLKVFTLMMAFVSDGPKHEIEFFYWVNTLDLFLLICEWNNECIKNRGPQPPGRVPVPGHGSFVTELQRNNKLRISSI